MHRVAALFASSKDAEHEIALEIVEADFDICLKQLSTLRRAIRVNRELIFDSLQCRASDGRAKSTTLELVNELKWHCQNTVDCLYTRLLDSLALRRFGKQAKPPHARPPYACYPSIPGEHSPRRHGSDSIIFIDHAVLVPQGGVAMARLRYISPVLEDLPSIDDLVRRWTNVRSDDMDVEPGANPSSEVQIAVE
jgi:hypothetical protein